MILNVVLSSCVVVLKREFWTKKFGCTKMCHIIEDVILTKFRLYRMMVERYLNFKEEVGSSIPSCEISSLPNGKLASGM
jgi:hypothetical protein